MAQLRMLPTRSQWVPRVMSGASPMSRLALIPPMRSTSVSSPVWRCGTQNQINSLALGTQSQINNLQNQIDDNRREARGGTALALAATGLRYDDRPGKLSVAGGFGNYKGETGLAMGLGYTATNVFRFNLGGSGVPNQGNVGVFCGAAWTLN